MSDNTRDTGNRRPLTSRSTAWARYLAGVLVRSGVSPDAISVLGIVIAAAGAWSLLRWQTIAGLVVAATCVQLRLLCNLLDGMVAIEGGRRSATGALFNEIPDRIADSLLIVALGYAIDMAWLGWAGALVAAVTAYIRVLGGSLGLAQDFRGPQAKPHRMAVLTAGCLFGAIELYFSPTEWALTAAAWIILVGSILTCGTRTRAIAIGLRGRGAG